MRYVFLDVDGVLNSKHTKEGMNQIAVLDVKNLKAFKQIMNAFYEKYGRENVKIILSSSWRAGTTGYIDRFGNYHINDKERRFLDNTLKVFDLYIDDETPEDIGRGKEISMYLAGHLDDLEGYVVFDDYLFSDFKQFYITRHLVKTSYYNMNGGLLDKHMKYANRMMEKALKDDEIRLLKGKKNKMTT